HERPEYTEEKRSESFHKCSSEPSASTGLRNVGTLAVRPRPNSISPKWNAKMKCDAVMSRPARLRPRKYGIIDWVVSVNGNVASSSEDPCTIAAARSINDIKPTP